jgi:hypothetical protein
VLALEVQQEACLVLLLLQSVRQVRDEAVQLLVVSLQGHHLLLESAVLLLQAQVLFRQALLLMR